jgi:hypothetical protein
MVKGSRWWGNPGVIAAGFVALAQFFLMFHSLGAGLVSSYPGIEYDGFDWVTQGLYVRALLSGHVGFPLLFLRSPMFVLVTALDALCGSTGVVVLAVLCLAHFVSLTALLAIWRRLGASPGVRAALFAIAALSPYAYFRGYILADPLAIAGMLASLRFLLAWFQDGDERMFRAAAATGLFAGLTQLYGILPFLTGAALAWCDDLRRRRSGWPRVLFTAGVALLGAAILAAWNAAIPHQDVPTQFGLLRPTLDMAGFYANVWAWYFGFLAPVLFVLLLTAGSRPSRPSPAVVHLMATTVLFVVLLFFYQSDEARFSWYYFPLVLCLVAAGLARLERIGRGGLGRLAVAASALLLVGQSLLVSPPDYWQPQVADARFDPGETWLAVFLRAPPVDRLDLAGRCGAPGRWCAQARLPVAVEQDERRVLSDYLRLRLRLAGLPEPDAAAAAAPAAEGAKWNEDWQ